ncbi:MAG TPA: DUF6134 family protein [Stellaceae bacterium]|nr:DUF6134 family protein [Stellaceae bacterium]
MSAQSANAVLRLRGFRALFLAQLLGAFNDNVLKVLVSLLAIESAAIGHSGGYLSLVSTVFMAPYLLFSGYAGYVADIFNKRRVLILVKAGEVAIMILAFAALIWGRIDLLLVVMFLLGTQATFFSPAKYGIVPEMLPEGALPSANGWLELSRYTAVILGTALGGVVLLRCGDRPAVMGLLLLSIAAAGFAASLGITPVPRSGAEKRFRLNPWREVAAGVRRLASDPRLTWTVAGISFFEFMGSLILLDLLLVGKETMGLDDGWTSLLGAFAGLGIGLGSVAAGRLSRGRVEIGLVPFGAAGLGAAVVALPLAAGSYTAMAGMLLTVGLAGGLVIVPLYSALQKEAGDDERGHLVSTNNFLNMTGVVVSAGALWLLRDVLNLSPVRILQLAGVVTLASTLCALRRFPPYAASAVRWARSSLGRLAPAALALIALPLVARGRSSRRAAAVLRLLPLAIAIAAAGTGSALAREETQYLVFRAEHQLFGDVGTVSMQIGRDGAVTRVRTLIDVRVTALGLTLRRMTGECRETWENGQLLKFASSIVTDGASQAVEATFDGGRIVVEAGGKRVYAPRATQPATPWSARFVTATTVMSPESGRVSSIEIVDLGSEVLELGTARIPVRHYLVRGEDQQHVYFDAAGMPAKFVFEHATGRVTLLRADVTMAAAMPAAFPTAARMP